MNKFLCCLGLALLTQACFYTEVSEPEIRSAYSPISYSRSDLDKSVQLQDARNIENSGKIYVFNHLLFVGEKRKGFHVFDNTNPAEPQKIKFLQVLGCTDVAIRNNVLFFNQATDLITVEYSFGSDSITLLKRVANVFPEILPPDGIPSYSHPDSVIIDWQRNF
ncbi:MAG: hypothetical protein ACPF8V_09220 [Luteibaculum sp.]